MTRLIITPPLWRLRAAIPRTRPCRTARERSTHRKQSARYGLKCDGDKVQWDMVTRLMPLQPQQPPSAARQCGARTKSGKPCRSPATKKGRCRLHGGARGKGGDHEHSDRLRDGRRPDPARSRRQPRPAGGNVTGVTQLNVTVAPKQLELLHELVPTATVMAVLIDPTSDPTNAEIITTDLQAAARSFGLEFHVLNASPERDFDAVFAKLTQLRAGGLVIGASAFFTARSEQLAALALRHLVPTSTKAARSSRPAVWRATSSGVFRLLQQYLPIPDYCTAANSITRSPCRRAQATSAEPQSPAPWRS
jgi:hypothetical protein